jgi:hypothetical protein
MCPMFDRHFPQKTSSATTAATIADIGPLLCRHCRPCFKHFERPDSSSTGTLEGRNPQKLLSHYATFQEEEA